MGCKLAEACFMCMRIILVILNCLFMLLGLALLVITLFLRFSKQINGVAVLYIPAVFYVLIAIGAFTVIVGFFGCLGSCRKSSVCLGIYITILLVIFIAELIIGIVGYIKLSRLADNIFGLPVQEYNQKGTIVTPFDFQASLQCCGVNGPGDYKNDIPGVCCRKDASSTCTKTNAFSLGCKKKVSNLMLRGIGFQIALGTIIGIALIEFIAIVFAIAVCCQGRRQDDGYVSVVT